MSIVPASLCNSLTAALGPVGVAICGTDFYRRYQQNLQQAEHEDLISHQADYPNPPAPAPPGAPETQQQMTMPGLWTPEQAIASGAATTQQKLTEFFSQLSDRLRSQTESLSPLLYAALAIAVVSIFLIARKGQK